MNKTSPIFLFILLQLFLFTVFHLLCYQLGLVLWVLKVLLLKLIHQCLVFLYCFFGIFLVYFIKFDNLHFLWFEINLVFCHDHLLANSSTEKSGCSQTRISNFSFISILLRLNSISFLLFEFMFHGFMQGILLKERFLLIIDTWHDLLSDNSHKILVSLDDKYFELRVVR